MSKRCMSESLKGNRVKQRLHEPSHRREDTAQVWNGGCFRERVLRESESRLRWRIWGGACRGVCFFQVVQDFADHLRLGDESHDTKRPATITVERIGQSDNDERLAL